MSENEEILARLSRLEKKNRRLQVLLFSIIGIFSLLGLLAFETQPQFFKVIETEKLILKDSKGKERAVLLIDTSVNSPKLRFKDVNDSILVSLGLDENTGYIMIKDSYDQTKPSYETRIESNSLMMSRNKYYTLKLIADLNNQSQISLLSQQGEIKALLIAGDDTSSGGFALFDSLKVATQLECNELSFYQDGNQTMELISSLGGSSLRFYTGHKDDQTTLMNLESDILFNKLELSDYQGKPVVYLGKDVLNGKIRGLEIYDTNRRTCLRLGSHPDGISTRCDLMYDGKSKLTLLADKDGATTLLFDDNGKANIVINNDNNNPYILEAQNGIRRLNFGINENGYAYYNMFDKSDNTRINMYLGDYGKPTMSLYDGSGHIRSVFGCTSTKNDKGKAVNHPESSIWLFNEYGNGQGYFAPNQ
jgi:hypothetical protein